MPELHSAGHGLYTKYYQYVISVTFVDQAESHLFRGLFKDIKEAEAEAFSCWPNEVLSVKVTPATQLPLDELQKIEVL